MLEIPGSKIGREIGIPRLKMRDGRVERDFFIDGKRSFLEKWRRGFGKIAGVLADEMWLLILRRTGFSDDRGGYYHTTPSLCIRFYRTICYLDRLF